MKKFFTLAVVAIASVFGASAGDGYIGGSVGFMHSEEKGTGTNEFTILPELGYNLNSKWAIGTTIGYQYKHWTGTDTSLNMFEFSPYARYSYYRSSNNAVQLFVDGGAGIGLGSFDYGKGQDSHTAVTWNVGFRPGVSFNVTDNFSVVAHVGFLGYKGANNAAYDGGEKRQGGFFLNGNDLTLGFYLNF